MKTEQPLSAHKERIVARRLQSARGKSVENTFDQVWVINLKKRPDRLARFWNEIEGSGWPFQRPAVFNAIEGDKVGVPRFWQTGGGSYGCLRSHHALLERAIQDDINSLLILEDDAIFRNTFGDDVLKFMENAPRDWQCLMLGGQHVNSTPFNIAPGIVRAGAGGGIQRTHCYALRGKEIMKALYLAWSNAAVHCDWIMGPCVAKFNTYAPDPFLVGQADGKSDISGSQNPKKFWRSPNGSEPVILMRAPRTVMDALKKHGFHRGHTLDENTGIDVGLADIFAKTTPSPEQQKQLGKWIEMIQWEAASMTEPAVCTIWHPLATMEAITPLVRGEVIEIIANSVEEALRKAPKDFTSEAQPLTPASSKIPVVILKAHRSVMEILRAEGWHTGHWRDEITGMDNGLRRLFSSTCDPQTIKAGLRDLIRVLHKEISTGGIVTIWHDQVSLDMLDAREFSPILIKARNVEDAQSQLKSALYGNTKKRKRKQPMDGNSGSGPIRVNGRRLQ